MSFKRLGWNDLTAHVRPGDVILVWNMARFDRHFEEGMATRYDLTKRGICIVSIQERIDAANGKAGARYYRRMMMANGALPKEP